MGGNDDAAADGEAAFDDAALEDGKLFDVDFDAEVAAGHHDDVRSGDDVVEVSDGFLVFDF